MHEIDVSYYFSRLIEKSQKTTRKSKVNKDKNKRTTEKEERKDIILKMKCEISKFHANKLSQHLST